MARPMRRITTPAPAPTRAPRRAMSSDEAPVPWGDYRAGKISLQQWVEGNRHYVALGTLTLYISLGVLATRPKKKASEPESDK